MTHLRKNVTTVARNGELEHIPLDVHNLSKISMHINFFFMLVKSIFNFLFFLLPITSVARPQGVADYDFGDPELLSSLLGNPEFVELFRSEKMRDYLETMLKGGHTAMKKRIEEDPEAKYFLAKLDDIMENHREL